MDGGNSAISWKLLCVFAWLWLLPGMVLAQKLDEGTLSGLTARSIGPARMSGRIADLDVVNNDPNIIYVGAAGGGIWKSTNSGNTFKPIFDGHTQSIGDITIDQSQPQTVWVGTGEPWVRNSTSVGNGIYRTTDGGENWQALGLEKTERIGKIVIDPKKSDTVYVAALGTLWNANEDRGIYKTTNGGKTWEKILYVDSNTGGTDIVIDPQEPNRLYAAMWEFRRQPWTFNSGGPGSGIFKSTDSGKTWQRLTKGMPDGALGRIALAIAPTRPNVVYATIEARKNGGLYRSDDLGENWQLASKSFGFSVRPFYFSKLVADPKDHQRIYKPGLFLTVSNDGGQTTTDVAQQVHSDLHALWINPDNTNHLVAGTDGGVYRSFDRGATWQFLRNIPVSQFYHVNYDLARPYNIYGGLQDNGSWQAPSRNAAGGIRNNDWKNVGYGDGFHTFADLTDANISYAEYQGGRLLRFHHQTREIKTIQPFPQNNEAKYRFNWNTPFVTSSRNPKVLYVGAQFVFRSTDKGESWQKISPDLTTNDLAKQRQEESGGITIDNSGAENHCTLFTIKDSPLDEQVIWAGSDDGNLQVTRDGGKNWVNVVDKIAGLPRNTWCSNVEPSNFDLGTAYVTFDGHQTGDMKTYVYKTTDFGQSWQSLVTADLVGYAHVIREDLVNKNLLFVGTELGLYVSIDGGKDWARFTGGIPKVAVRDLAIHPREGDLIIATHGRGIYIIDDLSPLRQFKPEMTAAKVTIFPLRPTEIPFPIGEQDFVGDDEFVGSTVGTTAYITYFLKERHVVGDFKIEIYDSSNKLITTLPGGRRRGFNQVTWVPRSKPPKVPPGGSLIGAANTGPALPEGTYTIKLLKNGETFTGQITLVDDPGLPHSKEDRQLQQKTSRELYQMIERLAFITELVSTTRDQARERNKGLKDNDPLAKSLTGLADRLEDIRKVLVVTQEDNFFGIRGQEQLRERLSELYGNVSNYGGRPTQSQLDRVANLRLQIEQAYSNFQGLIARELTEINTKLAQKKLAEIKLVTEEEFKKKEQ